MKENKLPIFLSSDDNFASLVAVAIASICYSTDAHIHFYVLDGGITEFHKKQITSLQKKFFNFDITFTRIDTEETFKNAKADFRITKAAYSRFLIPDLFSEINKALYLDVDIVVLDDIMELFTQDLHGYPLGAVPHQHIEKGSTIIERLNISSSHLYFNSGVLLIDCEQWREKSYTTLLLAMTKEDTSQFITHDQCLLNKFFENNYQAFDYRFNAMSLDFEWLKKNNIQQYNELLKSTVIRHYETSCKPFTTDILFGREKIPHFEDFWFFAEMTPFYSGLKQSFLSSIIKNTHKEVQNIKSIMKKKQNFFSLIKKEFFTLKN